MRNAFADEITRYAQQDDRVVMLSGDIGNRLFDPFISACPERFFNCGVAEANLIGMAAGMAMCGLRPVAYTIAPFITTRCLEQIRVDLCYHRQPVVIVGVGGGLSYASLGGTHHACEDIGLMRLLPDMSVLCPGDAMEVRGAIRAALAHDGPVYVRLGKRREPVVHDDVPEVTLGKSIPIRHGTDVALLAVGNMLPTACEVSDLLEQRGVSARVESFLSVKPLDDNALNDVFGTCKLVAVIEEHSMLGGCGSAVAEWIASERLRDQVDPFTARLITFGTRDEFMHQAGSQDYARAWYGLTVADIQLRIHAALQSVAAEETNR